MDGEEDAAGAIYEQFGRRVDPNPEEEELGHAMVHDGDGFDELERVRADGSVQARNEEEEEDAEDVYNFEELEARRFRKTLRRGRDGEEEEEENEEDEEGEDLFGDGFADDYRANEKYDRYDEDELDHQEYGEMDADAFRLADLEVRRRQREREEAIMKARAGAARDSWAQRLPSLFVDGDMDSDEEGEEGEDEEDEMLQRRRARAKRLKPALKRQKTLYAEDGAEQEFPQEEDWSAERDLQVIDPGVDFISDMNLKEFLVLESTRKEFMRRFRQFLNTFKEDADAKIPEYVRRIQAMCSANKNSLPVSYTHLVMFDEKLAQFCVIEPEAMIDIFDEAARQVCFRIFSDYRRITKTVHVRITELLVPTSIRNLRKADLNTLVKVVGVVTRRTSVFPQLTSITYECARCHFGIGPFSMTDPNATAPLINTCPTCQSRGPFYINNQRTVYRNFQRITLQESPGSIPAGRLPRSKDVILLYDLIDNCKPGEEIEVIGIFRHNYDLSLNRYHGFPVFSTIIEANNVIRKEDNVSSFKLSEDDEKKIRELSRDERILERITASIAPSIFGHNDIKLALALALFGGQTRILKDQGQHRIRGDINVLLLGDPGTAKSQFLKFVEKTAYRAVFTTGKGSTAVGLTAAVHRDALTKEWTLEGGALVLADKGVCLIDEFDKMNDKDRTSIHEAMEQQSISISKAGIVTNLQARCSVIAAANPIKGRYDASLPFQDNVELTEPILSRFDVLLVVRDIVNETADEILARFVVQSHIMNHPLRTLKRESANGVLDIRDTNVIPHDLLRKYIAYARSRLNIKWRNSEEFVKLSRIYADLRQESQRHGGSSICMRHVESAMRLAEACARLHLREYVRESDMNLAIRVIVESFVGTHKFSTARLLHTKFSQYISYKKDNNELLYFILDMMMREKNWARSKSQDMPSTQIEIEKEDFEYRAREYNITECRSFYSSRLFLQNNFQLRNGVIIKTLVPSD